MLKHVLIFFLISLTCFFTQGQVKIDRLLCENRINPVGIDKIQPRLGWIMTSDVRNLKQTAYEIQVADDIAFRNLVWGTGKTLSGQSVYVPYSGKPLESSKKYYWRVRVWDNKGKVSKWSSQAYWQMGLLNESNWKARWIQSGFNENLTQPAPMFRKEFPVKKPISSAVAFITSYGWYEAEINGKRVVEDYFTPGWTSYKTRLQYQMYDVTSLLKTGDNAVGVTLGNGWYREKYLGVPVMAPHGLSLLFQLEITYTDGSTELVVSDGSWKTSTGPVLANSLYLGQVYDGRLEKDGWTIDGYDDSEWAIVKVAEIRYNNLIATNNEPVRKHETFKPIKLIITPKGEKVLDFGQNLVGWVQFKIAGKAGDMITVSHAEVLDKEGNFYTENLRTSKAQAIYYLKGKSEEILEPAFSFFGFRYIRIEGYSGDINPDNFKAIALYSDMQTTGTFECSDTLVNQLQSNILWGQKGNFIDVPTDCPQRDERIGWTGDAQVFSGTAAFNMNVHNFFVKWLKDLQIAQKKDGVVPWVVPDVLIYMGGATSGWSDAVTVVPWNMYLAYGDKEILSDMYDNMKSWVDYMTNNSRDHLFTIKGTQFGDWLFYSPSPDDYGVAAVTDKDLISQCFYAHSTQLLINAAEVLKKENDVQNYTALLTQIKEAFLHEFVTPSGRLLSGTQTAYVLALNFDMLPEEFRAQAAQRLADNVKKYDNHLTTGFLGTPYLTNVLSRFGYTGLAYALLFQKTYPSWLYPVTKGATTIWERWDGIKPDGTLQTPSMNSYNHYSYGAIGDWMYKVVAGLNTDEKHPGYKVIKIKPYIGKELSFAKAELETYYGKIKSGWNIDNGIFTLDVEIPVNTKAIIYVPAAESAHVTESGRQLPGDEEIVSLGYSNGYHTFLTGSGNYKFSTIAQSE
ncbi:MAG: family 78 glycoside hydrolase catalytic domain [Bacteroidales bacterium]|nr:family 78 glycoside hydrolase catalytic domain [Bacteroidales bacterium]